MGFKRVGKLVDVQHLHPVQLGHFVQVEVVGHDLAAIHFGKLDQLHIHFMNLGEIVFENAHR